MLLCQPCELYHREPLHLQRDDVRELNGRQAKVLDVVDPLHGEHDAPLLHVHHDAVLNALEDLRDENPLGLGLSGRPLHVGEPLDRGGRAVLVLGLVVLNVAPVQQKLLQILFGYRNGLQLLRNNSRMIEHLQILKGMRPLQNTRPANPLLR